MTVDAWLKDATQELTQAGIGTARLDALVLLEDVTDTDRAKLLADPSLKLSASHQAKLKKLLSRRARHEPLAYVRGKTEFYGREFVINPAVLEPRPESETMIDLLKNLSNLPAQPHILDVGTGSGALGVTAQLELPEAKVDLVDLDSAALKVAKTNVDKFTLNISTVLSDLLTNVTAAYDVLLCNLPYVPDNFQINPAAMHEPHIAIYGGPDGLNLYRRLFDQIKNVDRKPLYILTEALPPQHTTLCEIAAAVGYNVAKSDDFIQVFATTTG